jgi:hypothetical protein
MTRAHELANHIEWDIEHNHPEWSFNKKHAEMKKWAEFRRNIDKIAFNAEQFNRRAAFIRKHPHISGVDAAIMFPTS